ncbi:MAG: hypothetical protein KHZ62_02610 [Clostridiales bacterium]|nr:hypothetical protein [Clostridiales bacterium]
METAFLYKKHDMVRLLEEEKEYLISRCRRESDSFFSAFFEHSVDSLYADAFEVFFENAAESNIFRQSLFQMKEEQISRFYKMYTMLFLIRFLAERKRFWKRVEMPLSFFEVFELSEGEQKLFYLLQQGQNRFPHQFLELFSRAAGRFILNKEEWGVFSIAFMENFCYNSFNSFMASFTRYISIDRRLEKTAE